MEQTNLFETPPPGDTLAEARARFFTGLRSGDRPDCECCQRDGHIDHRKLNTAMAIGLAFFYHQRGNGNGGYAHMHDQPPKARASRDTSRLKHWGMVEQSSHTPGDDNKRTSGMWRITETGVAFVEHRLVVPRVKHVFDDRVLYVSEETTDMASALGDEYDYLEVLNGVLPW